MEAPSLHPTDRRIMRHQSKPARTIGLGIPLPEVMLMSSPTMTVSPTVDMTAGTTIGRLDLPQYSLRQILAVWLAVTVPMSILGWGIAPWLSDRIGGRDPFMDALLICFDVGLIWMIVLVLILVRREQESLSWSHLCDALWLRAPRDPKSGRVGGG